jgi:hypothetical protein
MLYALRFLSLVFTVLALIPAGAHLFSLPSKMRLSAEDYLSAQRAYEGWALFGIVILAAILATLALAIAHYRAGRPFLLAALALLCLLATQALFWTFTFPANQATENWTMLPANFEVLRTSWEYSHAGSAVLNFAAFLLLLRSEL